MRLEFRPLLVCGTLGHDGVQDVMLIDNEQSEEEQGKALWHEVVHLLLDSAGWAPEDHDEEQVEEMACRLAKACPEIVGMLKATTSTKATNT